jgi:hypothetical protein
MVYLLHVAYYLLFYTCNCAGRGTCQDRVPRSRTHPHLKREQLGQVRIGRLLHEHVAYVHRRHGNRKPRVMTRGQAKRALQAVDAAERVLLVAAPCADPSAERRELAW